MSLCFSSSNYFIRGASGCPGFSGRTACTQVSPTLGGSCQGVFSSYFGRSYLIRKASVHGRNKLSVTIVRSGNGSLNGKPSDDQGLSSSDLEPQVRPSVPRSVASLESEVTIVSDDELQAVTTFVAETLLPTRGGKFRVRAYRHAVGEIRTEPTAIISGAVEGLENVPVRVHDACFTSEVLGSMKCDCAEQLKLAMDYIQSNGPGVVIYLQQEGRGIGLANKIAAYALQEEGFDTVDANRALGLPDDCREYSSVLNILKDLRIGSIQLMTNNPRKVRSLSSLGVVVTKRIPCIIKGNKVNQGYLDAKQSRMSHDMSDSESNILDGSWCYWDHSGDI